MFNYYQHERLQRRKCEQRPRSSLARRRKNEVLSNKHHARIAEWAEQHVSSEFAKGKAYSDASEGFVQLPTPVQFVYRPPHKASVELNEHKMQTSQSEHYMPPKFVLRPTEKAKFLHGNFV